MLCDLEVVTKSGQTFASQVAYHKGHYKNPLSDDEVGEKFLSLAEGVLPASRADGLLAPPVGTGKSNRHPRPYSAGQERVRPCLDYPVKSSSESSVYKSSFNCSSTFRATLLAASYNATISGCCSRAGAIAIVLYRSDSGAFTVEHIKTGFWRIPSRHLF